MKVRTLYASRTFFLLSLSLLVISSLLPINTLGQNMQKETEYVYVCNQGSATLSVINAETHEITDTVDLQELGFSANAKPHHAIAEPDGSYWYVTLIGENKVLKFNRKNELVAQTDLEVPGLMALHPDQDFLYVGRSMSAVNPPQSFGIIRRSDMKLLDEIDLFFTRPHAIATTPDGDWTYIASLSVNQILSMNTETEQTELTNLAGNTHVFVNFAISPDGNAMVGTGQVSGKLLVFDIKDAANPTVTDTIDVKQQPWHPVFSHDGRYVYFANKGANAVTVVDMKTRTVDAVIKGRGLAQPHGAVLSSDGKWLFVTNNNLNGSYRPEGFEGENLPGTVTVIDTRSRSITKVIEVGNYPSGIGARAW